MAQRHKSALKRHRQSVKRAARNRVIRSRTRNSVRDLRLTIGSNDVAKAEEELRSVVKALDKAVTKGVLHRNNASRQISRLSRHVARLRESSAAAS